MPKKWTPAQHDAIYAQNSDILVSASAGSGKTSVLIERIAQLLKKGESLERMLIVTFTKAAASEMKERLQDKLYAMLREDEADSAHFIEQIEALPYCHISTLHSFCLDIMRRYPELTGIDARPRLLDEVRAAPLLDDAAENALDAFYEDMDEDAMTLNMAYDEKQIKEMALDIYRNARGEVDMEEWLSKSTREAAGSWGQGNAVYDFLYHMAQKRLSWAQELLEMAAELSGRAGFPTAYAKTIERDQATMAELGAALAKGQLPETGWGFANLSSKKEKGEVIDETVRERFKYYRNMAKEEVKEALRLFPLADAPLQIDESLKLRRALVRIVRLLCANYSARKAEKRAIDYGDMEHFALKVLSADYAKKASARRFDYVFVDEYQDISRTQEAILRAMRENNHMFMVGDVKQSIYRFRLAEPKLFLQKYEDFADEECADERRILLRENFRSRKNILLAVNEVFESTMRREVTEIEYDARAQLSSPKEDIDDPPVELHILLNEKNKEGSEEDGEKNDKGEDKDEENSKEEREAAEKEAELIAERILSLLDSEIEENGKKRKAEFRDMVILMRSVTGKASIYIKTLLKYGIPVYSEKEAKLFDILEINDLVCLLSFLDNQNNDNALLGALSSPLFSFSPDELIGIRNRAKSREGGAECSFFEAMQKDAEENERAREALQTLADWRFEAKNGDFGKFISKILYDVGFYTLSGVMEGSGMRRGNLRKFASEIYASGQDLNGFVALAERMRKENKEIAAPSIGASENVVRLTTIHKSKGLEYPIVFVAGLGGKIRTSKSNSAAYMDSAFGIATRRLKGNQLIATPLFTAVKEKQNSERLAEEARLLYVAMTRAKERLILTGTLSNFEKLLSRLSIPLQEYNLVKAQSMLELITIALRENIAQRQAGLVSGKAKWDIRYHDAENRALSPGRALHKAAEEDVPYRLRMEKKKFVHLPQKISITALIGLSEKYVQPMDDKMQEIKERIYSLKSDTPVASAALLGMDGNKEQEISESAQRAIDYGNAVHSVFCLLPLAGVLDMDGAALRAYIADFADELLQREALSEESRQSLSIDEIARFFESPIGRRALFAKKFFREQSFSYLTEEGVLVQGVVDGLILEEDGFVIVDYKTDRDGSRLKENHKSQVGWYMEAISQAQEIPVKAAYVYYVRDGRYYEIKKEE